MAEKHRSVQYLSAKVRFLQRRLKEAEAAKVSNRVHEACLVRT